jgi:phage protein D
VLWQDRNISASAVMVEVEDHDRLIDQATVVLEDPTMTGLATVEEGQTIKIDMGWMSEHAVLFEGRITQVEGETNGGIPLLRLTALDLSHLMHREVRRQSYTSGTLSSVLREIVGRYPELTIGKIEVSPDPSLTQEKPLHQINVTDLQLLYDLAMRHRCRVFVEFNDNQSQLYFVTEQSLLAGEVLGTLSYAGGHGPLHQLHYYRVAAAAASQRQASVADPKSGKASPAIPPATPAPVLPDDDSELLDALERAGGNASSVYDGARKAMAEAPERPSNQVRQTVATGLPSDPDRAQAAVLQDATRRLGLRGEGLASGTTKLRAKGKVTLTGIAPWAAGDWYVEKAVHIIQNGTYLTRFVVTR